MIHIKLKPSPENFDDKVRKPGHRFLTKVISKNLNVVKEWNKGNGCFWTKVLPDMMSAYHSICAYSSLWIIPDQPTIDHYISKKDNYHLAYEWNNFRLARWRINTRKSKHENVLDPFSIGEAWFVLDFTTFEIQPNPDLTETESQSVIDTRDNLDLNHSDYCDIREAWFEAFRNDINKLRQKSPFIAYEAQRQGIL